MQGSVTVHMDAPPQVVWDLVSDITRIGEFSPETFEAEWVDGAAAPEIGAHFRGHVKRNGIGPVYWTKCKVIYCEPERDFGFLVYALGSGTNTWRYQLAPKNGGTEVTESFQLTPLPLLRLYWTVLGKLRGRTNERGMRQTLERIKAIAEADAKA
jgi:hypothetical protein